MKQEKGKEAQSRISRNVLANTAEYQQGEDGEEAG